MKILKTIQHRLIDGTISELQQRQDPDASPYWVCLRDGIIVTKRGAVYLEPLNELFPGREHRNDRLWFEMQIVDFKEE